MPEQNNNIQFQGDEFGAGGRGRAPGQIDMMDRLVGWGIARDRTQAQYILIGVIIVSTAIAIYVGFFAFGAPAGPPAGVPGAPLPGMGIP